MAPRPEVVRRRLEKLEEYLAILRRLRRYDRASFLAEPERYGSAERFLQLSIETVDDLAAHVVAELGLGTVEARSDLPRLLFEHGTIDAGLRDRWTRMIGFRNILVHDYLEVDRKVVYEVLQDRLGDFGELARAFAAFL